VPCIISSVEEANEWQDCARIQRIQMEALARDRGLEGGSDERAPSLNDPRVETSHRAKLLVRVALRVSQSISPNWEVIGPKSSGSGGCWVEGYESSTWWRSVRL
jgi:hypothetical protein